MKIIEINGLHKSFGEIKAVDGISFCVNEGELFAFLGQNGAGKSTTISIICGRLLKDDGSVTVNGCNIDGKSDQIKRDIGVVFQNSALDKQLTVYENLLMGAYSIKDTSGFKADIESVYERFPRLAERKNQIAGTLSGGEQQMLAMGRALLSGGEMIVMDEPSMGLSPLLVSEVFEIIQAFREQGKTVLLVEQNAKKAMSISDRVYVLETGAVTIEGNATDLINDERIKKAYLGE